MTQVSRFWVWIGVVMLVNCMVIAAVLVHGDHTDVRPSQIVPADGANGLSGRPTIQVTYPRSVDAESLRAAFRIEPPVPGEFEQTDRGLSYRPGQALRPGTNYAVVIAPGVREVGGRTSRTEVRSAFQVRPARLIVLRRQGTETSAWLVDPNDPTEQTARRLTDPSVDVQLATASPLGDALAYVTTTPDASRWSLATLGLDSGTRLPLIGDQEGTLPSLAWSPKGDLLAYEYAQAFGSSVAQPRLWLTPTNGGDVALMYGRGRETGSRPSWSPDGRRVAFYDSEHSAIGIYDFTTRLQSIPAQLASTVSWSPGGDTLAYTDRSGEEDPRTVNRVASLKDGTSRLLSADSRGLDSSPVWSPAGDWIAFTRLSGTSAGVWLVHPDGSEAFPIQVAEGWVYSAPVWAPDGSALAFSRHPTRVGTSASDPELWLAAPNGKPHQLDISGSIAAWIP
jgi:dipeptidyl aminopeptidase/acylaminoacyl peptidase